MSCNRAIAVEGGRAQSMVALIKFIQKRIKNHRKVRIKIGYKHNKKQYSSFAYFLLDNTVRNGPRVVGRQLQLSQTGQVRAPE